MVTPTIDARVQEYWDWLAVVLFLLITVDMVTTIYATRLLGPGGEANPVIRWSLLQGMAVFAAVNLVAVVLAVVLFDRLVDLLLHTRDPWERYLAAAIEAWLGVLLAAGLGVFANNLMVIFLGRTLTASMGLG